MFIVFISTENILISKCVGSCSENLDIRNNDSTSYYKNSTANFSTRNVSSIDDMEIRL